MRTDPATQAAILALIPGSVPLGTWTVRPIQDSVQACTMLDTREAHLPSGALPEDRMILLHEEGHIRWDLPSAELEAAFPAVKMPYVGEFYRMLREWVIDARLTQHVEDIRPSTNLKDWTNIPDPSGHPLDAIARQWMQWYYRSLHPAVCQEAKNHVAELWVLLDDTGRRLLGRAYKEIMADLLNDHLSEQWAVTLAAHFAPPPPPPQPIHQPRDSNATHQNRQQAEADAAAKEQATTQARQQDAQQQSQGAQRTDANTIESEAQTEPVDRSELLDENGNGPDGSKGSGGHCSTLHVHEHMNMRRSGKRIKDPIGMKTSGAVPTHTEYLRMGGAIFKESPKPSGTILIDCSASMNWTESQLQEAIRLAPNLIVAGYCSWYSMGSNALEAMLCIIARGGRTSQSIPCASGGGNQGSDLPSLVWLAKQPGPRIIVSDGAYYGTGNYQSNYENVCNAIMKRNRITRVETMQDALSWLKGRLTNASTGDRTIPLQKTRRRH